MLKKLFEYIKFTIRITAVRAFGISDLLIQDLFVSHLI